MSAKSFSDTFFPLAKLNMTLNSQTYQVFLTPINKHLLLFSNLDVFLFCLPGKCLLVIQTMRGQILPLAHHSYHPSVRNSTPDCVYFLSFIHSFISYFI
jgi:hypothetical protein